MIPIIVPSGEDCYCGQRRWVRFAGRGCSGACCEVCGYVAVIVAHEGSESR